jgi:hypothetical protein
LDVWVKNITPITGKVSIGFNWTENFDSTNPLHWSWDGATVKNPTGNWQEFIIHSQCPEYADVPTGGCKVVLGYEQTGIGSGSVFFDTVIINATVPLNGTGPPPTQTGADGFVAQAIQAYWALKNHSYDDDHIFLMINAGDRDVRVWTPATNDFLYTEPYIDVNGTDVNSSRFVKELNISISGSWASRIRSNDELLLYMIDHGSNNVDPTKNATFHFDAGTFVTEQELDSLLDKIICKRMILMFDMCFAGNFMQPFLNASANRVLIGSSAPPKLSWYWISASINHFAGSFFFHPFWDTLNQTGKTLMDAITAGANHWPFNHLQPVSVIQGPISPGQSYIDNVGILNSWTL